MVGISINGAKALAHLHIAPDIESTAIEAADFITALSAWDIHHRGRFTIALSGGSTPRFLYQVLATPPYVNGMAWDKWEVFWSDERSVPPDHSDSNYRMAKESLLDSVPIPRSNIHCIKGELGAEEAARSYEAKIKGVFKESLPSFDLVLLGIGTDGHTASLFRGTEAVDVKDRLVMANRATASDSERITFTLPIINAARSTAFLVTGQEKAEIAKEVFQGTGKQDELPAALVQPDWDAPHVFLDPAAASLLSREDEFEFPADSQNGRAG